MLCSWFRRRVILALLLAAACVPVGSLTGDAAAAPAAGSAAGLADPMVPRAATPERASTTPMVRLYSVRPGDSLSAIAARHRYPGGWPRLYAHNRKTVGNDPNRLFPGQTLRLVSPRHAQKPTPNPQRRPVTKAKAPAPARSDVQPVRAAAKSRPDPVPNSSRPTLELTQPTVFTLAVVGLLAAALTGHRLWRRGGRPVADRRPLANPTPTQIPIQVLRPRSTLPSEAPSRPAMTAASHNPSVSFSLVLVADDGGGADLTASLSQLAALERRRLEIVVVVGADDPAARSAAEAVRRRIPGQVTVVTDGQRPRSLATAVDSALPACHGEVTGVLAGPISPELLERVAAHVRHNDATMVWAGTRPESCRWSSSRAPGRLRLRLLPRRGQLVFVRTELLRADRPTTITEGQLADVRRTAAAVRLGAIGHHTAPDEDVPDAARQRQAGAV